MSNGATPDTTWFLPSNSSSGLPAPSLFQTANPTLWGSGTFNAGRANPWDTGCLVQPYIGGYETLSAPLAASNAGMSVLDALTQALTNAQGGQTGHIYVSDWRLNSGRDISQSGQSVQTPLGLLLKIMDASVQSGTPLVKVCALLWLPAVPFGLKTHQEEHIAVARTIQVKNQQYLNKVGSGQPSIGACILDNRVPSAFPTCWFKSHHQKMMLIRVGSLNVAFVGGVDLAFTRRDSPGTLPNALVLTGQPQSGAVVTVTATDGTTPVSASYTAGATDGIGDILSQLNSQLSSPPAYLQSVAVWQNCMIFTAASGQSVTVQGQVTAPGGAGSSTLVVKPTTATAVANTVSYSASAPQFLAGDAQSGDMKAYVATSWLSDAGAALPSGAQANCPTDKFDSDMPADTYFAQQQFWHDQHLMLQGAIVSTLESQFGERWIDTVNDSASANPASALQALPASGDVSLQYTWVTLGSITGQTDPTSGLYQSGTTQITALDSVQLITDTPGSSLVQMWRTIPLRDRDLNDPNKLFQQGEFTVLAGIANAVSKAQNLIFIVDQYFFSEPLAQLLCAAVQAQPALRVILVLPPAADAGMPPIRMAQHALRHNALNDLFGGTAPTSTVGSQIAVYNLWHANAFRGIYCHTKVQTYDGALLVCGSANMNRRSYSCDTELDCAVLDSSVVSAHLQRVWNVLLPNSPWAFPATFDLNGAPSGSTGPGQQFFDAFVAAAAAVGSNLVPDPCYASPFPVLPNLIVREEMSLLSVPDLGQLPPSAFATGVTGVQGAVTLYDCGIELLFEEFVDPSSIDLGIENAVASSQPATPFGAAAAGRLDSIAYSLTYDPSIWRPSA